MYITIQPLAANSLLINLLIIRIDWDFRRPYLLFIMIDVSNDYCWSDDMLIGKGFPKSQCDNDKDNSPKYNVE